ncbi:MAG TPA: hypothetical protein VKK31_27560 [Thermoanaerobaculia bacterium]|nr:hypothetical protein [Thermoanaerobaculia bacterium]
MSRPVRQFEPLWFDHHFRKDFKKLPKPQQSERLAELARLATDLSQCSHPTHDPRLAAWKPSAYHVPKIPPGVTLFEYRGKYPLRVIARWIEPSEVDSEGAVLLVAVTLSHDHKRLKEVIGDHRARL